MFTHPVTILLSGCALAGLLYLSTGPQYSSHLLCTYGEIYRLRATIDVDGETYSSQAVRQTTRSRDWSYNLNRAGCESTHGLALPFRLRDNRVVLLRATLCSEATAALRKARTIDVGKHCDAIHRPRNNSLLHYADGYIVDNAERPASWSRFRVGTAATERNTVVRLTGVSAERVRTDAQDDFEAAAPGLLKASFKHRQRHNSPEELIPYLRRSAFYRQNDRRFLYEVEER